MAIKTIIITTTATVVARERAFTFCVACSLPHLLRDELPKSCRTSTAAQHTCEPTNFIADDDNKDKRVHVAAADRANVSWFSALLRGNVVVGCGADT